MKLFVYGPGTFFVVKDELKRIGITQNQEYRLMEDGRVAVHLTWLLRGFEHSASYPISMRMVEALDWCESHAHKQYLMHQDKNVLFKDPTVATMFKLAMSG